MISTATKAGLVGLGEFNVLKIQRTESNGSVIFEMSGRLDVGHAAELKQLLRNERHVMALDLREVRLIDREAVEFLAMCEANGVELRNCPEYMREWISRERERTEKGKAVEEQER